MTGRQASDVQLYGARSFRPPSVRLVSCLRYQRDALRATYEVGMIDGNMIPRARVGSVADCA
jgi:hypothetical protein